MDNHKIKWNDLLFLSELEFIGDVPKALVVSDELQQSISFLTGATNHDRKLLRCDENGALLVADAWSNLTEVETDELHPASTVPDTFTSTKPNKGVLVGTSLQLVYVSFVRIAGGAAEVIYIPPYYEYWYPHPTYSVTVSTVPATGGTASYVGITAFD